MKGIAAVGAEVARGDQKVNSDLQTKLIEAISHKQENYWIGKPCGSCFPAWRLIFNNYVDEYYKYLTHAVLFCNNGHWGDFVDIYVDAVKDRTVCWVGGDDQDLERPKQFLNKDFHVDKNYTVPTKDAWSAYDKVKDIYKDLEPDSVVCLSCGPMSRVLAYEWFKQRPDCTILDLGSTFDPFTRDVWWRCHAGTLPYCPECNYEK